LPTDYLSLSMPEETRYYVPKLQAIKNIIAQPEVYGLKLDPMPNRPYFGTVDRPGDMDIALAAKLAETPLEEFIALNPAYQRPVMLGASKTPIVLPADKVQTFIDNLGLHESQEKPLSAWKTYTLKKGDKLDVIAGRYDISTSYLKQLNGIGPRSKIGPGTTLLVPGKDAPNNHQFAALDAKLPDAPVEKNKVCTAKRKGKTVTMPCKGTAKPPAGKNKTSGKESSKSSKGAAKGKSAAAAKSGKPAGKPAAKPATKSQAKKH
jgi:membrane-bound lytic murein transglycosylase D